MSKATDSASIQGGMENECDMTRRMTVSAR